MQEFKTRIDTGTKGNPSTGDILYEGGEKLNTNTDSIYNVFGDFRLNDSGSHGVGRQKLHATGYYQKHTRVYYMDTPNGVEMGSLHDVDTSDGKLDIKLPAAKLGEGIIVINSNGSLSPDTPVVLNTYNQDVVKGHGGALSIDVPRSKTTLWCTKVDQGVGVWEYRIEPMFGNDYHPIDTTVSIGTTPIDISIGNKNLYNSIKFMIYASNLDQSKFKSSEVTITLDHKNNKVYKTEYAVLKNTDTEMYELDFITDRSTNLLRLNVKSEEGQVLFTIKSINTIRATTV